MQQLERERQVPCAATVAREEPPPTGWRTQPASQHAASDEANRFDTWFLLQGTAGYNDNLCMSVAKHGFTAAAAAPFRHAVAGAVEAVAVL